MFETVFSAQLIELPWWAYVLIALILTHITIAATTIYLHRCMAHRAVDLNPLVSHFFRFWLWLTTGTITQEWVAVHRKHHAHVETKDDPHSPQVQGINRIMWLGAWVYHKETHKPETLEKYGYGCPTDWLERYVYSRLTYLGPVLMLAIDMVLFGPVAGFLIWLTQMLWIPLWAAGVVNGLAHYWGYRNFATPDASRNITPWGLLIGGEELHNNHHAFASSAKFSNRPWEFDLGWMYIRLLSVFKLAKVRRIAPKLRVVPGKVHCDMETLQAVIESRFYVMSNYAREVMRTVCRDEIRRGTLDQTSAEAEHHSLLKRAKELLNKSHENLDETGRRKLTKLLRMNPNLNTVYTMKQSLLDIWERSTVSQENLLAQLQDWCHAAEASGIESLRQFANRLKAYQLVPFGAVTSKG